MAVTAIGQERSPRIVLFATAKGRLADARQIEVFDSGACRKPLGRYAKRYPDRNEAITAAYASGGYTLKAIGQYFGLQYAHVSRVISRARKTKYKTPLVLKPRD